MDHKRHVEVSHVLIGLIRFSRHLEQLGNILSFAFKLRDAGLDRPLITLRGCVRRDAGDLGQVHLRSHLLTSNGDCFGFWLLHSYPIAHLC